MNLNEPYLNEDAEHGLMIEDLAVSPPNTIVSKVKLAEIFGVNPRTIQRMVDRRELPPPITLAKQSRLAGGPHHGTS